jgi:hypothetical protein
LSHGDNGESFFGMPMPYGESADMDYAIDVQVGIPARICEAAMTYYTNAAETEMHYQISDCVIARNYIGPL